MKVVPNQIICSDNILAMKSWPDDCIDSIITDPPYALEFMGKGWDKVLPSIETWEVCLRIAKPGAIMLCFGGTRTFHRVTCAIEDAGWQIRDCLMWLFGQGFPKSHNITKAILKMMLKEFLQGVPRCCYKDGDFQCDYRDSCHLCGELLQFFQVSDPSSEPSPNDVQEHNHPSEPSANTLSDIVHKHRASCVSLSFRPAKRDYYCHIASDIEYGVQERKVSPSVPYYEQSTKAESVHAKKLIGRDSSNTDVLFCKFVLDKFEKFCRIYDTVSLPYNHCSIAYHFCQAQKYIGYGSALKPSFEPIIVAMKPLDGTFAHNAEKYGVAGLNIDGGRIDAGIDHKKNCNRIFQSGIWKKSGQGKQEIKTEAHSQGRWPANLILDEEAAAMLDKQSGELRGPWGKDGCGNLRGKSSIFKMGGVNSQNEMRSRETGGASRFFYCAKASKRERGENNNHPTVKPLKLMEYLCTLLKPPSEHPILLDPFCGSGTTLMAAFNTGWDYIGIDKEPEYVEIAKRRVSSCKEQRKYQMFA